MKLETNQSSNPDYMQAIEIAEGIYWVGFDDSSMGLRCNPYLVIDGNEAVLIDGGSRGDFSTVMMKILMTGFNPHNISRLIYQHYDPDLCGNLPHLEALIDNKDLRIISHRDNNTFIHFYSPLTKKLCIEELNYSFTFKGGRELQFIHTPYAHVPGSFITWDIKSKTLFTSDIFGSYDNIWDLYVNDLDHACLKCEAQEICPMTNSRCPIYGIITFHERIMNSTSSLTYALEKIEELKPLLIAPQHGSLINSPKDMNIIIRKLKELKYIGFDFYMHEKQMRATE